MFGSQKLRGKENKEEMFVKEKVKEKKNPFKINKLFYRLLQTHFTYFHLSYKD